MPRAATHCCDLCEPDFWPISISILDSYDKPRVPSHYNPREYERGSAEHNLREALVTMRQDFFKQKIPGRTFLSPQSLMPTTLLDRIVDLVHYGRLSTIDDVHKQLQWAYNDACSPKILDLIGQFCPVAEKQNRTAKPPPASPFISTPLRHPLSTSNAPNIHPSGRLVTALQTGLPGGQKERKQTQCSLCGAVGHNHESSLFFILRLAGSLSNQYCREEQEMSVVWHQQEPAQSRRRRDGEKECKSHGVGTCI